MTPVPMSPTPIASQYNPAKASPTATNAKASSTWHARSRTRSLARVMLPAKGWEISCSRRRLADLAVRPPSCAHIPQRRMCYRGADCSVCMAPFGITVAWRIALVVALWPGVCETFRLDRAASSSLLLPARRCPRRSFTSDTRFRKPLLFGLGIGFEGPREGSREAPNSHQASLSGVGVMRSRR